MTSPIKIDPDIIITKNVSMLASKIDNETVMMDVDKGKYYGMNHAGSRIWELLESPRSLLQLQTILLSEFDTTEKECLEDTKAFIIQLLEKKMVRI